MGTSVRADELAQQIDEEADLACRWQPDLFFPEAGGDLSAVRKICSECPVRAQCLELALIYEEGLSPWSRYGFWGGVSPRKRATLDTTVTKRKKEAA